MHISYEPMDYFDFVQCVSWVKSKSINTHFTHFE